MKPFYDFYKDASRPFKLLVVSGFSGSGKGSILDKFRDEHRTVLGRPIEVVTSYTTRSPRYARENYHFVSPEKFQNMVFADAFLEYSEAYSNHSYGTPIEGVLDALNKGAIPCLEIDHIGLKKLLAEGKIGPNSVVSVFITAPADELYRRLCNRDTETCAQIRSRLLTALQESYHVNSYQNVIFNSDLNIAVEELQEAFEGRLQTVVEFDDMQFRKDLQYILDTMF